MKLLKVYFDHLRMFEAGKLEFDFYSADRVPASDESAYLLEKSLYSNNVIAVAGINASGKTTVLNLIEFACAILDGAPVNQAGLPAHLSGLFEDEATFRCAFHHDGRIYLLESLIRVADSAPFRELGGLGFSFSDETLWSMPAVGFRKATLSDWDELRGRCQAVGRRAEMGASWDALLYDDISIAAPAIASAYGRRARVIVVRDSDQPRYADVDSRTLTDILKVFDQKIERLEVADSGRVFSLTFEGREPFLLSRDGLDEVLSSGTQRGLALVQQAVAVLKRGGYLLVDELENHLNHQLVNVVIDLFASRGTNPNGAVLVFTTHYPHLLDAVHRKDNVYFLAYGDAAGMTPIKYSDKVKRIENKKSEVFVSNFIRGTAPRYTDVKRLKSLVEEAVSDGR